MLLLSMVFFVLFQIHLMTRKITGNFTMYQKAQIVPIRGRYITCLGRGISPPKMAKSPNHQRSRTEMSLPGPLNTNLLIPQTCFTPLNCQKVTVAQTEFNWYFLKVLKASKIFCIRCLVDKKCQIRI